MDRDSSDGDGDGDRDDAGLLGAIGRIVEALADAERDGRSEFGGAGRHPSGHFTTEYGYAGRIGIGDDAADSGSSGDRGTDADRSLEDDDTYRVDVRYEEGDDELLVVADLPDVSADELNAGIDTDTDELVIEVDNRTVDRLALPWPVEAVDSRFRHGILELRFTPEHGSDDGADAD